MSEQKKIRDYVKPLLPRQVFELIEPTGHLVEATLLSAKAGHPAKKMRIIGVTGTNGKTTTSFMIHSILVEAGIQAVGDRLVESGVLGLGTPIRGEANPGAAIAVDLLATRLASRQPAQTGGGPEPGALRRGERFDFVR